MLVDHADAKFHRLPWAVQRDRTAPVADGALVWEINAGENVHQRGFACAVLPQQRVDLTGVQGQVHVFIGDDAGKALGDAAHFQQGLLFHRLSSLQQK